MNGVFLLIPFFVIRFIVLAVLDRKAVPRAAHFAPMEGQEKIAYYIYQISNVVMFVYILFLSIKVDHTWKFYLGLICYIAGLVLCTITMVNFSTTNDIGMNTKGLYSISRNPMYIAYFICFIGMAYLTDSLVLLTLVLVFQISAHWIILAEERWCKEQFGKAYIEYMIHVNRYI